MSLGSLPLLPAPPWIGPGAPAGFVLLVPNQPVLVSANLFLQGALVDAVTGRIGLTNALHIRIGP